MDQKNTGKKHFLQDPFYIAVLSAMIVGVITHLFGMVNILHNYDNVSVNPFGYGTGLSSGRWFLTILGDFTENLGFAYNLPLVNGLIFLLILAFSAGFLVSTLKVRGKVSAALIGMIFVVFPTATSTMYFRYTAIYYGVAILLSVLAAWVMHRNRFSFLLSAVCTALSLGIYQAYTPVTIAIFVLMLMQAALRSEADWKELLRRGIYYCASLAAGLILYYVCLKVLLAVNNVQLNDYQGINQMGQLSLSGFPYLLKETFAALVKLPIEDYCGLASTPFIRFLYLLIGGVSVMMIAYLLFAKVKKVSITLFTGFLCCVFPVAVNFVAIMCPNSYIYTLMVYGFVLVPCLPIVIYECLPEAESTKPPVLGKELLRKGIALVLALLVFSYAYEANISYSSLYYANRQAENYFESIVTQVRMTEGFTAGKTWAFLGSIQDPLLSTRWNEETRYGGNTTVYDLINGYSFLSWIYNYMGYGFPVSTTEEVAALSQTEEVRAMPCWPDQGSIKVIGDTVVIKFQELAE